MTSGAQGPVAAWRLGVRAVLLVGVGAYIALGPMPHQMFGARHTGALPRWRMFSGMSLKECAGWFERRDTQPPQRIDDWFERLGLDRGRTRDRRRAWISKVEDAERLGTELCEALGPPADVRLHLRCPHRTKGWVERSRGDKNLCAVPPKKARNGRRNSPAARRHNKASPSTSARRASGARPAGAPPAELRRAVGKGANKASADRAPGGAP